MSRSVSIPSGAVKVVFADATWMDEEFDFTSSLEWMQEVGMDRYPSLEKCSRWLGREDRAVLENQHAYITVSEYCGLVAVAVVPKGESKKANEWASKVRLERMAESFGDRLTFIARASNGEAFYQRAQ